MRLIEHRQACCLLGGSYIFTSSLLEGFNISAVASTLDRSETVHNVLSEHARSGTVNTRSQRDSDLTTACAGACRQDGLATHTEQKAC